LLKRRQNSASSRAGKFALDAKQQARPTIADTLNSSPASSATAIDMTPIATAAMRATYTSSDSESRPLRSTLDHRSWAIAPEAEITRPATTARIVASATADTTARN